MLLKRFANKLTDLFLSCSMSFCLVYALISAINFPFTVLQIILINLGLGIAFFIAFQNKTSIRISIVIFIALLGLIVYQMISDFGIGFINDYLIYLSQALSSVKVNNASFELFTLILLSFSISFFTYIFTVEKFRFLNILIFGILIFVVQTANNFIVAYTPFYIFVFLILIYYFKNIYYYNTLRDTHEYVQPYLFILFVIPIVLLVFGISTAMPTSANPIEWKWLDSKVVSIYQHYQQTGTGIKGGDYFSISSSGFNASGSTELGGSVRLDNTLALKVVSDQKPYLRGSIKDSYTGRGWTIKDTEKNQSKFDMNKDILFDIDEMTIGMLLLTMNPAFCEEYFNSGKISITYENVNTKSLFTPSKTLNIKSTEKNKQLFLDHHNIFSYKVPIIKGFNYELNSYQPKYSDESFKAILRTSQRSFYATILRNVDSTISSLKEAFSTYYLSHNSMEITSKDLSNENIDLNTVLIQLQHLSALDGNIDRDDFLSRLQSLSENANKVTTEYTEVPKNLPERISNLAFELTKDKQNTYDKAKAVEEYLSSYYMYTLTPPPVPPKTDFVDYFLFESKKGYCSYYATAMTVMLRSIGIPARYVEGYIFPSKAKSDKNYEITNKYAHAWVEVYFEGYGWLNFEPTSGFSSGVYTTGAYKPNFDQSFMNDPNNRPYISDVLMSRNNDITLPDEANVKVAIKNKKTLAELSLYVLLPLGVLFLFMILLVLINSIRRMVSNNKILKLSNKEAILKLYNTYYATLTLSGITLRSGETPSQFSNRVDLYFDFPKSEFTKITSIFSTCRYSNQQIHDTDKEMVSSFRKEFYTRIQTKLGRRKYWVYTYLLGKI